MKHLISRTVTAYKGNKTTHQWYAIVIFASAFVLFVMFIAPFVLPEKFMKISAVK